MTAQALNKIRVLELTTAVAGPVAGCVLADMGAEVIKIESPGGRSSRSPGAPLPVEGAPDHPYNRTPFFNELHRGKKLLSLDLKHPDGKDIFVRLVKNADVVMENFSPKIVGRLGIDYAELKKIKTDIICVSMPAFGKTGPYESRASYGPGIDAMSGLSHLTGYPDRGPGKPAQFYCDQNAGLTAALTVMGAIRYRNRTGQGQYIELAMLEGEMQLIAPALMEVMMNSRSPNRIGNKHERFAPQGVYKCKGENEWVAITVRTDLEWQSLAELIGNSELANDPRFSDLRARKTHHDDIDKLIESWTSTVTQEQAENIIQAAGIPAGALLNLNEAFTHQQFLHRNTLVHVEHPEMGTFPHTRTAWISRNKNDGVAGPAPTFGNANSYVLTDLLNFSAEDQQKLKDRKVVSDAPLD
jgi:crotonobetainyl-CoA:carnitine CoA-transferase CaiB-like acyl-CoA transferase